MLVVSLAFSVLSFKYSKPIALGAIVVTMLVISGLMVIESSFKARLWHTATNVEQSIRLDNYESSAGYRIEFYKTGIKVLMENPYSGVGVGDVADELASRFNWV